MNKYTYIGGVRSNFLLIGVHDQNSLETTALADGISVLSFFPLICPLIVALLNSALHKYSLLPAFRHCVKKLIPRVTRLNTTPSPREDVPEGVWLKGKHACSLPLQCNYLKCIHLISSF